MSQVVVAVSPAVVDETKIRPWVTASITLAVIAGIAVIILCTVLGVTFTNGMQMKRAFTYAGTNDECCGKTGVVCTLESVDGLPVPNLIQTPKVYSPVAARYAADLITRLALHRNQQHPLTPPQGMVQLALLGEKLGWVLIDSLETPTNVWVVFRGTSSKEEWNKDFELQQVPYAVALTGSRVSEIPMPKMSLQPMDESVMFGEGIKVHRGFLDMYRSVRAQLVQVLKPYVGLPLYVCGHSLGAALASLCTLDLSMNAHAPDIRTYTFAPPRVGNPEFAEAVTMGAGVQCLFQIVNMADLVFSVPLAVTPNIPDPENPWIFQHAGKLVYFIENWGSWKHNHTMPIYIKNLPHVSIPES